MTQIGADLRFIQVGLQLAIELLVQATLKLALLTIEHCHLPIAMDNATDFAAFFHYKSLWWHKTRGFILLFT